MRTVIKSLINSYTKVSIPKKMEAFIEILTLDASGHFFLLQVVAFILGFLQTTYPRK